MIDAGADIIRKFLEVSPVGARRWASQIWDAMASVGRAEQPAPTLPDVPAAELKRVELRLQEAAAHFKIWSARERHGPSRKQTWWPEVIINAFEAHNAAEPGKQARIVLYGVDIARMHEAMRWITWLERQTSRIVWGRAERATWRALEDQDGRSHMTLRKIHREGLLAIARRLTVTPSPQSRVNGQS